MRTVDGGVVIVAGTLAIAFCVLSLLHIGWALGVRGGKVQVLPERGGGSLDRGVKPLQFAIQRRPVVAMDQRRVGRFPDRIGGVLVAG